MGGTDKQDAIAKNRLRLIAFGFFGGILLPQPSFALHLQGDLEALPTLPISGHHITFSTLDRSVANFLQSSLHKSASFGLYERGRIDFRKAVADFLRQTAVNPLIEIRSDSVAPFFNLTDGSADPTKSHDFRFHVRGTPLCGFQVRGHELSDGSSLVMGNVPDVDLYEPSPDSDWPSSDLAAEKAMDHVAQSTNASLDTIRVRQAKRCFYVANRSLLPVWEMIVDAHGASYQVRADGYEVMSSAPRFFDVDGVAKVFRSNPLDPTIVDIPLPALKGDGTLTSEYFRTVVPEGSPKASEANHIFAYDPSDGRFDEAMVFAQAQVHFDYFQKLGFSWYGPKPLVLKPRTATPISTGSTQDNALFTPGGETDQFPPTIIVGTGSGEKDKLQNLSKDGDVVSHEFGHFVVYKTLSSTDGEALVLHEGLADFFVFSRTGDTCLGESICPAESRACFKIGQCLRTASNSIVYGDRSWEAWAGYNRRFGHLHGQLISGYLWDLRKAGDLSGDDLARLTLKAVSLFAETSGVCDFLTAILAADRELFASSHEGAIREKADKRGFGGLLAQVPNCPVVGSSGSTNTSSGDTAPTETKKKKRSMTSLLTGGACGVTAASSSAESAQLPTATFLALLAPLLLAAPKLLRKPSFIRIKIPARSRKSGNARKT